MPAALYVLYGSVPKLSGPTITEAAHTMQVVAVDAPIPDAEMKRCLPVAHLRKDHKAHVAMMHASNTPGADGLAAMYVAAKRLGGDLVGVVNPITCMCLTPQLLDATLEPEFLTAARKNPAATLGLWLGFVKLFKEDGSTWLITTGAPMCKLPNLGILAERKEDIDRGFDVLSNVLGYLHESGKSFGVGHTLDLGEDRLVVRAPYEFEDYIGTGTLILAPRK